MTPARTQCKVHPIQILLGEETPHRESVLEAFFPKLTVEFKHLPLFGLDCFRIALWIDPEQLELKPLLIELTANSSRFLMEPIPL
jgi:hypothetical protein